VHGIFNPMLLCLTANLRAASRDPQRWPQAWAALCQWVDCPDVFGSGELATTDLPSQLSAIAACSTQARHCAQSASGRCGSGSVLDEDKRRSCLALVDYLDHALTSHQSPVPGQDTLAIVLDTLPFPLFVCDVQRHVLYANTLGEIELNSAHWLRWDDMRIVGASPLFERRIASALDASDGQEGEHRLWLVGQHQEEVDLVWRRVTADAIGTHWVLRLAKYGRQDQVGMAQLALALGLSARQRELAEFLLDGCTLTEAAQRMGIVRGSANQLLKHLFTATGTRRQPELLAYLSRRLTS